MAASTSPVIELWNDIENNGLIVGPVSGGWDGTEVRFSDRKIYQASQLSFRWYPIKKSGLNTYIRVPVSGLTLDIAIGQRSGAEAIKARQNVWTEHSDGYLYATLNLNTTDLNNLVTGDTYDTYLEIQMTENGNSRPTYQEAITIRSVVIGPAGSSALPAAADQFLTRAQCLQMFVKWTENLAGNAIELASPDGTKFRLIGVNDDGSAQDEIS
jgi:hypothetical protein